jgi:Ca2+-binding RTX toxin-like protein
VPEARRRWALGGLVAAGIAVGTCGALGQTEAAFSDYDTIGPNSVAAGVWITPIDTSVPERCAAIHFNGPPIVGTDASETIVGTNKSELIVAGPGDDIIDSGNGTDCVVGGSGNDALTGGDAKDVLLGGPDNDVLDGSNGADVLDGGPGADHCIGGNGPQEFIDCETMVPGR